MIAIDAILVQSNGDPFTYEDTVPCVNSNYIELIDFFNSCVTDSLVLNTMIDYDLDNSPYQQRVARYYAINTVKATEFQERFMSITAPFSMKQFWIANGFDIQSMTQTQIVFEDEPADKLVDLVDVNDCCLWGDTYPIF